MVCRMSRGATTDVADPGADVKPAVLGQRLREAREAQRIGLRVLAKRVNVSASLISQVERGKVMPSVGTLYAIVRELGISIDDLFSDDGPSGKPVRSDGPVQHADTRKTIYLASGVRWESLTLEPTPELDFLLSSYEVGAESCPADAMMSHGGFEHGYVLKGKLRVAVGSRSYDLVAGDSISFASTQPHRLANAGEELVEAVWLVVGRERDDRLGH